MYCSSIHFLINNANKPNRAQLAFDEAEKMIATFEPYYYSGKEFVMADWLRDAKDLNDKALAKGLTILDPIPEKLLNCRFLIGWL